ncbi:MAG: helix-turn-helix domain-containing protein [Burkholderiaceae bacterium]|jgi:transcriptional regulator with XRE-family HTH domain|nr:helix-turn-helix domain-containing protein [Burkholderiaceae bacterium]
MAKPSVKHAGNPALRSLGKTVRAVRAQKQLSQEALAHGAGLDRSYMGGIERGEHNVTVLNLLKIAEHLGISASELFGIAKL